MNALERLQLRTGEPDDAVLMDCIECAKNAILARRYPYQEWPTREVVDDDGNVTLETYVEPRYEDLLYRIAMDLYNKTGAEGELGHLENGINRQYESSWISEQLLLEVTPMVKTI